MMFSYKSFFNSVSRVLFTFLFLCPLFVFSQQSKPDSLQKLLAADKEDTSKIKHMNQLCWVYINTGQYAEGMKSADAAIILGKSIKFYKGLADSYNMLGNVYLGQGELRKAEQNFLMSMEIQKDRGDKKGMAAAYNNLALVYDYLGELGKALEYYSAAVKLNIATGNKNWLANNYNNIGSNYSAQGKTDEALENFIAAKKIKEEIGETKDYQYTNTISNIGNIYFYKKQYDKALGIYNSALIIRKEIKDEKGISDSYITIGSLFLEQAKVQQDPLKKETLYKKADENMKGGMAIKEEIGDLYGLSIALLNIGNLHMVQNKMDEAHMELQKGVAISLENDMHELTRDLYMSLAACDSATGKWKSAYEHQKLFKQFNDTLFNTENSKKIAEMNSRFETEKKEEQIVQLEKEKKRTWWFVCIFAMLVLVVLFFARRAYNNKKKVALFEASESNRKEVLLQEVHHRINNNLQIISSLLSLQAESVRDEKLYQYLKQSQNRIQSLSALHELLYQTDSPLKIGMKDYLEKVLDFHRVVLNALPAKVEVRMNVTEHKFATKLAVPIALIVNELVTNAIKYAFNEHTGGHVNIYLQPLDDQAGKWVLRIADSGKGLPEETGFRADSLGLRLVKIMTRQIKGTLEMKNDPGATFEIEFTLTA